MSYDYEQQEKQLKAKIKQLAADVQACAQDPAALKAFLKEYQIPKAGPSPLLVRL